MESERRWERFIRITAGEPPWPRLARAAAMFEQPGDALDVGAGGGRDTAHLLREGWRVTAVDSSPFAATALKRMPRQRNLQFILSPTQDFEPGIYDLVNAQFSLPFIPPADFDRAVRRLQASVRPGGVMAATFFGPHDEWNIEGADLTFSTREEVERTWRGWELVELTEVDEDSHTADGTPKHWHVFHVIARRRAPSGGR